MTVILFLGDKLIKPCLQSRLYKIINNIFYFLCISIDFISTISKVVFFSIYIIENQIES